MASRCMTLTERKALVGGSKYCTGLTKQHEHSEVYFKSKYMRLWLYWEYMTILLVNIEVPTVVLKGPGRTFANFVRLFCVRPWDLHFVACGHELKNQPST